MPKFTIELPEGYSDLVPLLEKYAAEIRAAMPATAGGVAVDMAKCERAMAASAATLEQESIRRVLQCLDIDAPRVIILGRRHSKVGRYNAAYKTKAGPVTVMRSIYRDDGVRNGPTVDPVSLRAGVVGDGWLPDAAQAMAFVIQQQPSREAHEAMQRVGRLPYSRSSFERVGHEVGKLYETQHVEIEATLITQYEIPVAAASVSVGLDRVSVPMEEPRARPVGRPRKDAPENPIERKFRMAYVGTVTMHDKEGSAVHTVRYGRMPKGDAQGLCAGMANDVALMLKQRPDLKVAMLADGAPEMRNLLMADLNETKLGVEVTDLVDFWHVIEKLGEAADLICKDAAAATSTIQRWKLALLNKSGAVWDVRDELHASGMEEQRHGDSMPVHDALTYLNNNGERMDYAKARREGLPIGSGNTEATCKSLFEVRLKRSGARWKEETGEHVVQLRALALSDRWDEGVSLALREVRSPVRIAA